ncbi:MAG: HAMP domain-containing histidine kinase [Bifidobacteriaceae bacterium]|jgi:signal transduction histidine kinase|nr:HAMP domain-containing histidine kinase [Bifidobacteriaceae bacterium]
MPTPDLRPLDIFGSIKIKLGVLVAGAVTAAVVIAWIGFHNLLGPSKTLPLAVLGALVVTQVLAHGMTAPLREMTACAKAMAKGDYSRRVRATSRDEVGELAEAFNIMAEDLAAADRRRRDMIANVSHELRTPVAALQAELENMADGVTEPSEETWRLALAQTQRLGHLVTEMLDLSRLEAGAVSLNLTKINLDEFFANCLETVAFVSSTSGKALKLVCEVNPANLTIVADPARLEQAITNLLANAIAHSPQAGTITISGYTRNKRTMIEVADQGPGIPPQFREQVFERFQRGVAPSTDAPRSSASTGLGLAIARWAVELHNGQITVADHPGPGCTMRITLPTRGPQQAAKTAR